MKIILATNYGSKTEVMLDDDDYEWAKSIGWHIDSKGYARCSYKGKNKFMARLIMKIDDPKIFVDHINGNTLDNRKCNLRLASNSQNQANRQRHPTNTSGFRGVYWNKKSNKWQAGIKYLRKSIHLGMFDTPEEAHEAYKKAAFEIYGDYTELAA